MKESAATSAPFVPKAPRQHEKYWSGGLREKGRATREANKAAFIERLGGKCAICGYVGDPVVFDFDHIDPSTKEYQPGAVLQWVNREEAWLEIQKCRLLCANCHRIETYKNGHAGAFTRGRNKTYQPKQRQVCERCAAEFTGFRGGKFCSAKCRMAHRHAVSRQAFRSGERPRVVVTEKRCSSCRETLPADRFYVNRSMHDGLYAYCKACFCRRYPKKPA